MAVAAPTIDKDYVKSLAAPGKTVLVIEYYDNEGEVTNRKGFASREGYRAISPTDFQVDGETSVHLYGLEPCDGELTVRSEDFSGTCAQFAQDQLQIMLKSAKVLFCRAFVSEESAKSQDATCYGYYHYPGSLDSVDMLEEQLVSLGALRVAKGSDGKPLREDLSEAETIGQKGYGMWADPRHKGQ
ncbi:hypothetical protein [Notoacmeibacter sp. MSK16QG-6]|uniref:hypothetical protein n=1 Tax=Notoacmeibacter sp. MSK16QG-6 TaxID=2957982 RepID=UPI00209D8AD6|nr:hypothetical protein [Notoacmeibacter sp. MSK16QG-6]MCP1201095.1 hypothetical protein [Notoacmeibacter sp. MSK16QG-6]